MLPMNWCEDVMSIPWEYRWKVSTIWDMLFTTALVIFKVYTTRLVNVCTDDINVNIHIMYWDYLTPFSVLNIFVQTVQTGL